MNLKTNLVCTGIDDNYIWPWMVSIYSAKKNSSDEFRVLLGHIKNTLNPENIELIKNFCNFFAVDIEFMEFEFNYEVKTSNLPIQAYIRLLFLDTLESDFMWLDSDTLLMSNWQSIFNLIERDNSDVAIRATIDGSIVEHNLKLYGNNTAYQRGGKSYFNSGVFIASPKVWMNKGFNVSWPKVAANHRELGFIHHDQDVLNYLLHDSKEIIHSSFNSIVMQGSYIDQKILHFTGRPKPWQFTSESQNYFVALEVLKAKNGKGAFGGLNWHLEYQNYWRYESAMMINVESDVVLREGLEKLRQGSKIRLMSFKDKFKFIILNLSGRKWI